MALNQQSIETQVAHFETVCRDKGIKLTQQRLEIYRAVACSADHPDAEQIFHRVRKRLPSVSLDTVYRTLWLLNDIKLVTTLGSCHESTRFDANLSSHHHFVCSQCGVTRDFYCANLDTIILLDSVGSLGDVKTMHVEARGICRNCIENK